MATADQISRLRRMTNASLEDYSDGDLNSIIDDLNGDLNLSAVQVWEEKAAKYSELVDMSESGSSRKQSALYENAISMAALYRGKADEAASAIVGRPRTRAIVRP